MLDSNKVFVDTISEGKLYVIDNALPNRYGFYFSNAALNAKYSIHKGSRFEKENDHYMAAYLDDGAILASGILKEISDVFDLLKIEQYLIRSYINLYGYWTPTTAHVDENVEGNATCLYWFNTNWQRNWGGELIFYDVEGRNYTIEYKPGRLIVFDSSVMHRVSPLTAFAKDLRFCLTLKCGSRETLNFTYNNPNPLKLSNLPPPESEVLLQPNEDASPDYGISFS